MKIIFLSFIIHIASLNLFSQVVERIVYQSFENKIWIDSAGLLKISQDTIKLSNSNMKIDSIIDLKTLESNPSIYPYFTDSFKVYFLYKRYDGYVIQYLDSVDRKTVVILNEYYAKDKYHVYYNGDIIPGAHAPTFELYDKTRFEVSYMGKDKNCIYEGVKPITLEYLKSQGL